MPSCLERCDACWTAAQPCLPSESEPFRAWSAGAQVRRFSLEKWLNEPFFEAAVTGALARVSIRGSYMLAEVQRVVEREPGVYKCAVAHNPKPRSRCQRTEGLGHLRAGSATCCTPPGASTSPVWLTGMWLTGMWITGMSLHAAAAGTRDLLPDGVSLLCQCIPSSELQARRATSLQQLPT